MRLTWLSDVHLEVVEDADRKALWRRVAAETPDAVLLTGDISQANELEQHLREIESALTCPVYFVLGNHDYLARSVAGTRAEMRRITAESATLRWLPAVGVVELTPRVGLLGHGCWGDGRYGDYRNSTVFFNEFFCVREFLDLIGGSLTSGVDPFCEDVRGARLELLNRLGDEAAAFIRRHLLLALDRYEEAILLTHVPPFEESRWHGGEWVNSDSLPHMGCKAVGDVLEEIMAAHPSRWLRVLSGHTHRGGQLQVLPNLTLQVGSTRTGRPAPQAAIEIH